MRPKVIFIIAASCGILSCTTSADSGRSNSDVSGVYVREYAFEVSNPETGKKVGMRQVRDSIFIERGENGYQVSNRKWRMNDHDQEGWVSMSHSDDRPLPTFTASYDEGSGTLEPKDAGFPHSIAIDLESNRLYKGTSRQNEYRKVQ